MTASKHDPFREKTAVAAGFTFPLHAFTGLWASPAKGTPIFVAARPERLFEFPSLDFEEEIQTASEEFIFFGV
jgi:hypothetical protein